MIRLVATVGIVLALVAYASPERSSLELEFVAARRTAESSSLAGSISRSSFCIGSPHTDTVVYRYPDGSSEKFEVDERNRFRLSVVPVRIVLDRFRDPDGRETIFASAELGSTDLQSAHAKRNDLLGCNLLVFVEGSVAGIDWNGSDWTEKIPLGVYRST